MTVFAALAVWSGLGALPAFAQAGPAGPEGTSLREQSWLIPSSESGVMMHATLFRPPGKGPFALAVINHGSEEDPRLRGADPLPAFPALTAWLVARGYAVLIPQRPGHGVTGGVYLENQGPCATPDYVKAGRGAAASIEASVAFMRRQPFVRPSGVLVIGNSAGGWGALAYANGNPLAIAAVVDFAGGRGGRNGNRPDHNCAPDRLVSAAATLGQGEKIPTLWLYSQNDTFFSPALSRRMADAFAGAGGHVEYHLLPPVPGDGHALINTAGADASWAPVLASFLGRVSAR